MMRFFAALIAGWMTSAAALADGVLIFGATGQLGAPHVQMLVTSGETVTAFVRPTSTRERLDGVDIQYAIGDLMDADSVRAAMELVKPRIVIDTSARREGSAGGKERFYAPAMQNIVDAAKVNGVEQIIIHSSVGVRGSAEELLRETYGYDTRSPNMLDKGAAEVILEESGVPYTIIRNGVLDYEPAAPTGQAYLSDNMDAFGRITRTDLAALAVGCIDNPECINRIYHAQDDSLSGPRPERGESE
jgi:uncharacterized protein YbjT (DUF2867 family)